MCPERQRGLPAERPVEGLSKPPTNPKISQVVIVEPHPSVRAVLEYLLAREGYIVESRGEAPFAVPGLARLLVAAEDGSSLYVFESRNAAETLEGLPLDMRTSPETLSGVTGIQAFVPKLFGAGDMLRVVRAVSGFDGRKRMRSPTA